MDLWIGASKLNDGQTWQWTDGSDLAVNGWVQGKRFLFSFCFDLRSTVLGFPNEVTLAKCAAMLLDADHFSLWINDNCFARKSFICETPVIASPTCPPQLCPPYFQYNPHFDACYHVC